MMQSFGPLLIAGAFLLAGAAIAQAIDLPPGPGRAQVLASCTRCHGVDVIAGQRRTPDEWQEVMSIMIGHGAQMTDEEYQTIVGYLATSLAPDPSADSSLEPVGQ
jgi:competence protein ComEA